jgi:hypothetical protein
MALSAVVGQVNSQITKSSINSKSSKRKLITTTSLGAGSGAG